MRRLRSAAPLVSLALVTGCTPTGGADLQQAVEAMIEVKVEMRMAVDELRQARGDLEAARADIDRARAELDGVRGDLDGARRSLDRTRSALGVDELDDEAASSLRRSHALAPELAEGIRCDAPDACTIKRATVDAILADPAGLAKQARVIPSVRDGETLGFKIYGIRTGSLPKLLGLKNGDLLTSINGEKLGGVDQAMTAFNALRRAKALDIVGERKGGPLRLRVTIVDG